MSKEAGRYRVGVIALHPIQYQAGLWRTLARHPRLDVKVIYLDRVGLDGSIDPTMKAPMKWDVPLLEGYDHEFVPNWSRFRFTPIIQRINPGLPERLRAGAYDAILVHGYLTLSNWLALWTARRTGMRVVYRGEGSMRGRDRHDSRLAGLLKGPTNRFFLRHCDAIAHSSSDNRRYQISRGADPEQLFPMPCAVDNETLQAFSAASDCEAFRKRHGIPDEARLILTVGRFTENKRTQDCIDALSQPVLQEQEDVHLLVAGDGPLRADLERRARELKLAERVHFLGFLGQKEIVEAALTSELFVLASSYGDPSPKALAEALFLGLPAVCSDGVGTCHDVIVDGENGFVFPTADVARMAGHIAQTLSDPVRRAAMGERSREVARRDDFQAGVDSLVARLDRLSESVVGPRDGGSTS